MSKTYKIGSLLPEAKRAHKELKLKETKEAKARLGTKNTKVGKLIPEARTAHRELIENA